MFRAVETRGLFCPMNLRWKEAILWDRWQTQGCQGAGAVYGEGESFAESHSEIKVKLVSGFDEPCRCISEFRVTRDESGVEAEVDRLFTD